jgi:signal transduction histidine kinase
MGMKAGNSSELARLRAENAALNEQIKLLVQTEQRLARSKAAIDHQSTRIRALSEFSLEMAMVYDQDQIFSRATDLVREWFDVERIALITFDSEADAPNLRVHDCRARRVEEQSVSRLTEEIRSSLGPLGQVEFIEEHGCPTLRHAMRSSEGGQMLVLPIHGLNRQVTKILAATAANPRLSAYRDRLDEKSLPLLQLLAMHVERAVQNATLNADLEERTEELLQARKMEAVGRLAGGVAHDFNNIITIVLGHAELLKTHLQILGEDTSSPESILEAAGRATRMTSQLLALGRRHPQRLEPVDVAEMARGMTSFFRDVIGEDIDLTCSLDSKDCFILTDRSHLEQILLNLVVNARDAIVGGGRITVAVNASESLDAQPLWVELRVADTGIGMDMATQERVFEPFFTTKAEGKGSGLGLSIVYGLVRQSGGSIELKSAPNEGTEICIKIPWTDRRPNRDNEPPAKRRSTEDRGLTILLVEDEDAIRKLAARTLSDAGYRVLTAGDGVEALEVARGELDSIDLLVSDVVMPRMGGPDLLRALRKEKPDLLALFMSGYSFENMKGEDVSNSPFLLKPFHPRELRTAVAKLSPMQRESPGGV